MPLVLSYRHCVPASLQVLLEQQGPPALPHTAQMELVYPVELVVQARSPVAQALPVGRVPLAQHGSPTLPQVQRPALQVP